MKKLLVNTARPYEILIGHDLLDDCGSCISRISQAQKAAVITDSNVEALYLSRCVQSLEPYFDVCTYAFPAGESSKTTGQWVKIVEFLAQNRLSRGDLVVALGGGVVGDMAGFAAASYMRGIDYVQIPTTLLAQIDSSVGGKTAVDLPQGKNLCGAFHQPVLVLIDPEVLSTLSRRFFSDGMGEAIKYGCIKSRALFDRIQNEDAHDFLDELIYDCVDIKRQVVEADATEKGERALLNFGHTVGHAIEKLSHFSGISHGAAVGIGMVYVSRACEALGLTPPGTADAIAQVLQKYDLPTETAFGVPELTAALLNDKKQTGKAVRFVTLQSLGCAVLTPVQNENIEAFLGAAHV